MTLDDEVREELRRLEAEHRLRVPRVVDSRQGALVTLDSAEVLNFASNDYLALAGDRRLVRAAAVAADEAGLGAGASRLIVGNHRHHVALEQSLAGWLRLGAARLFNSGYAANLGVLTALLSAGDVVFSDELNHASIIDGCRLSRAEIVVYPHLDYVALEAALRARVGRRRIVVSETLFSMDGDVADVATLRSLASRHDAALVLDEAHAIGAWGPEGRGVAAEARIQPDVLIGTCGKALGGFGAFVASSAAVVDLLWNRARSFVFSTGLPPMVAAAVQASLEIVRGSEGAERRRTLARNAAVIRAATSGLGGHPESPVAPLLVGDDRVVMERTSTLLDAGIYVQGIRPPTVPEGTARLRISLSAGHSEADVARLAAALAATSAS